MVVSFSYEKVVYFFAMEISGSSGRITGIGESKVVVTGYAIVSLSYYILKLLRSICFCATFSAFTIIGFSTIFTN